MKKTNILKTFLISYLILMSAYTVKAQNIGLSAYDFTHLGTYVTGEAIAKYSGDTGIGAGVRLTHTLSREMKIDAGYNFHDGFQKHRFFSGFDYELFPDYQYQPRMSLKGLLEVVDDQSGTSMVIGLAPIFSKGVALGSVHTYPFVGLPLKKLIGESSDFEAYLALGSGVKLTERAMFNFETNINLSEGSSSLLLGLSASL